MTTVVLSATVLSSCHTTREEYPDRGPGWGTGKHRTERTTTTPSTPSTTTRNTTPRVDSSVPTEWQTLDVKLSRHDNRKLYYELKKWLGTPYRYGGHDREGTDCSGLVMQVYKEVYGITLERNSARMCENNCKAIDRDKLRNGDLVFFGNDRGINHVGIYLRDGYFVHASSSRGVIVSHLDQPYFTTHFRTAATVTTPK